MPLKLVAPARVYAPKCGKRSQSPTRSWGSMTSLKTQSIESHVGPKTVMREAISDEGGNQWQSMAIRVKTQPIESHVVISDNQWY
jgi:hypothetical protein